MASQDLIDEYKALGGTDDVTALSDDDLAFQLMLLQGQKIRENAAPITMQEMGMDFADPKVMTDEELMASLTDPMDMQAFNTTGAVDDPLMAEQRKRDLMAGRSFIENLSDPETANFVVDRMARQAAGNALNTLDVPAQAAGLYGIASLGVEELANLINGDLEKPNLGSAAALDFANDRYIEALNAVRTTEPRNMEESLAGIAGMMIPIPGPNKVEGAWNIAEMATPFIVGQNKVPRLATNFATAAVIDQGVRELMDNPGDQYDTAFDMLNLADETSTEAFQIGSIATAATFPFFLPGAARAMAQQPNPPPTIKAISELDRLGPENLYTVTKNSDLIGAFVLSDTDSVIEIARRAGVPNIDDLQKQFDTTTQSAAASRVTEALAQGKMPTNHGTFTAPVAPRQLAAVYDLMSPKQQVDVNNYMLLGNYADVIKRRQAHDANALQLHQQALANDPNAPKPVLLSKPTDQQELADIAQQRATMRMNIPMLNEFSKGFQELTAESRRFISEGPYALIDKATKQKFDLEQPHYVPIQTESVNPKDNLLKRMIDARKDRMEAGENLSWLEERDIANIDLNTLQVQQGALPSVVDYVGSVLHAQLKNNAKGAYIDAMLQSGPNQAGKPLVRKATAKEVEKYPERIVDVVRAGKTEHYITESFIARTLALDPYVLNNPIAMGLYATKRAFETGTTGAGSITFPATSLLRDTLAGWANTSKGAKGPGFGVITAPAEILGAKATKAFYQAVMDRAEVGKTFLPGVPQQWQEQWAARAAAAYQNTFYHLAQQHGGYDASIMKDRIRLAKGELGEIIKSIPTPVKRGYEYTIGNALAGIGAIMDAMLEAPRYNAAKRTAKATGNLEEALVEARKMTGDTSKSGRSYTKPGNRGNSTLTTGDVVDPEWSILNPAIANAAEFGRIATPYFNPMVKGFQRVAQAAAADPVRFAARNWLAVGLPAVAGYAWNKYLSENNPDGHDYNDYQFNKRSTDEQIMEMYFGLPGLPPERGLSIPIAHEQTIFSAPFLTFLQHMGGSGEELSQAMTNVGMGLLTNGANIGLPPAMTGFLKLQGVEGVDTLIGGNSAYQTREDNVGVLPQNVESALRAQFGTQAAIALEAISAFVDDGDLRAPVDEFMNSVAKRLPIVKGIGGWRTNGAYFTPIAAEQRKKLDAYYAFDDAWKTHFDQYGMTVSLGSPPPEAFPDANGDMLEIPFANTGPVATARPVNPLYELYGQLIHDSIAKKDPYGFPATRAQMGALTDQIRLLKGFNAGRADDFKEWQNTLENTTEMRNTAQGAIDAATEAYEALKKENGGPGVSGAALALPEVQAAKKAKEEAEDGINRALEFDRTARFLQENNIDLSNRFDVIRLTNLLEQRRVDLMKYQLSIIEQIENDLTAKFQADGLLPPDETFQFERHLAPMANPGLEAVLPSPEPPVATDLVATE